MVSGGKLFCVVINDQYINEIYVVNWFWYGVLKWGIPCKMGGDSTLVWFFSSILN